MSQTIPLGADARERFLLEIAAVVPPERIAEAHFFAPLRQGQIETGVAVLAVRPEGAVADDPEIPADQDFGASISSRHVVYSARYRWTRKGPERGKWESEVVAEADAPLLTVEAVVQGVKERLTDPEEPTRLPGDVVRAQIADAQQRWQTNS